MKKIINLLCFMLIGAAAFAQLPDGSTAPDFTYKDLSGKEWNLYEILETGRPVVMDISATWCGPCWGYHQSGALDDLYEAHGPEGDATMMVLWFEGDNDTNRDCLYGSFGCNNSTQGDWVSGTSFPIIDEAAIFSKYSCGYYPTIFTVFPDDKTLIESGAVGAATHWNIAQARLGDIKDNLVNLRSFESNSFSQQICNAQDATPKVKLRNMGKTHLTSLTLDLVWNGQTVQTVDWTGDAGVFDDIEVTFSQLSIGGAGSLEVVAKAPNGDMTAADKVISSQYIDAPQVYAGDEIRMNLVTDNQGAYLYWAALDEAGNIIVDGGNKTVGLNGGGQYAGQAAPADPGSYNNFQNLNFNIPVPANRGCISIVVVDGAGDGFFGPGRYRLFNTGSSTPFFTMTDKFTSSIAHTFAEMTSGTNTPQAVEQIAAYPNPTADEMTVEFSLENVADMQMTITNTVGQVVKTVTSQVFAQGLHQIPVAVNDLPNGMYFLNLRSTTGGVSVQQFVVAK